MLTLLRWTTRVAALVIFACVGIALHYAVPCRAFTAVIVGYVALSMASLFALVLLIASFRMRARMIEQNRERAELLRSVTAAAMEQDKRKGG